MKLKLKINFHPISSKMDVIDKIKNQKFMRTRKLEEKYEKTFKMIRKSCDASLTMTIRLMRQWKRILQFFSIHVRMIEPKFDPICTSNFFIIVDIVVSAHICWVFSVARIRRDLWFIFVWHTATSVNIAKKNEMRITIKIKNNRGVYVLGRVRVNEGEGENWTEINSIPQTYNSIHESREKLSFLE